MEPSDGRRSRKKVQTRLSIEEAALTLFAEYGYDATTVEQISDRADVSTATFFRYFPSKADVILCQQGAQLPVLQQAILDRPAAESGMNAVRAAIAEVWVPAIDPDRTMRTAMAVASSAVLRGLYGDISRTWLVAVAEALAERSSSDGVDGRSKVAARVALAIFGGAVESWVAGKCREALSDVLDREFDMVERLFGEAVS